MTTNASVTERTGRAQQILARCVCLVLERHYLGNNRKIDPDDLVASSAQLQVDADCFTATKQLIDPKYLAPARSVMNRARAMLRSVALPAYGTFGESAYLVPNELATKVNADLNEMAAEVRREAAKLATVYQKAMDEQKAKLGPAFKLGDYARPEQVADAFSIDWRFVSFAAPENLSTIDHALAEEADRKYQRQLANAFDEVLMGLRSAALDIVSDLVERLGPDETTGKPRVIRSSALDAVRQFAELLPQRNVGDDDKLAKVVGRLVDRAKGLDVQQLRDEPSLRQGLHAAASEAQKALAALVKQGPRRGIRLPGAAA